MKHTIVQCDRCGVRITLVAEPSLALRKLNTAKRGMGTKLDMCADCDASLTEWFEDPPARPLKVQP